VLMIFFAKILYHGRSFFYRGFRSPAKLLLQIVANILSKFRLNIKQSHTYSNIS
jgi:hypothetical protein